jgi:hypothetical protein
MWAIVGGFSWCPNWPVIWADLFTALSVVGGVLVGLWVLFTLISTIDDWHMRHQETRLARVFRPFRFLPAIFLGIAVMFMVGALILGLILRWFPCN